MTVEELRDRMSAREFQEWHSFARFERWIKEHQAATQ